MLEAIGRYWRVFGVGFSFFAFGVGGLAMRVFAFPLLSVLIADRQRRAIFARDLIRGSFRCFVGLMRALGVMRYDITGVERLDRQGLLIVANHPTLIDIVLLMAFVKRADCIVKSGLWHNPFTYGPVRAAGYIRNDSGVGLIEDCIASVRGGSNLIIFPEGTRTRDGSMMLKRGAANIAVRAACNVTPVFIRCTPPVLRKGQRWWQATARSVHFCIEVEDDIDIGPFIAQAGSAALAARQLTDHLRDYFITKQNGHAVA
ncbi:MAG TPA: lysophospholipid acyltransferase family protein [Candidatus Binatia bacterium]|jgi:1-acyl-sn-glycerol-3-phosphate acyltransferase